MGADRDEESWMLGLFFLKCYSLDLSGWCKIRDHKISIQSKALRRAFILSHEGNEIAAETGFKKFIQVDEMFVFSLQGSSHTHLGKLTGQSTENTTLSSSGESKLPVIVLSAS